MRSLRIRVALLAAVVFLPLAASATVVLSETFEQLTVNSHLVVRGKAGASVASWDATQTRIDTATPITVTQVLRGELDGPLVVWQPGGKVGKVGQKVAGAATFKEGEEVVLFLEHAPNDPKHFFVRSMSYGKITLQTNALGELRAFRDTTDIGLYDPESKPHVRVSAGREDLGAAEEFLGRIRRAGSAR